MIYVTEEKTAMAIKLAKMIFGQSRGNWLPYTDAELVEMALRNSFRMASRGKTRRSAASAVFGTGSSVSSGICRRFGFDPDEVAKNT
jgi:hypothetical protein